MEFLEAAAHGCVFTGIYVFAIELFNEKHHVLGYVTAGIGNSVGDLLFGVTVMFLHDFRTVLRIFNIPGLFVFFYFLFICESVRWLLATGRIDRAITTIKRIAKFNRLELSEKAVESIKLHYSAKQNANEDEKEESVLQLFWTILKTRTLCFRFVNGCLQWILCCFSYYGVYQHATQIPGSNHYVSFVILIAVATPMNLLVHFLFNRLKRRIILFCAYFVGGIMIIITLFIPKGQVWAVVICYIISKSLIGFAFTGSYIYAAEQFPTNIRATMLNTFNMVGRFGSMSAPYVIILVCLKWHCDFTHFFVRKFNLNLFILHNRHLNILHFHHYCLVVQPSWQQYQYYSVRKHFGKSCPTPLMKPSICKTLYDFLLFILKYCRFQVVLSTQPILIDLLHLFCSIQCVNKFKLIKTITSSIKISFICILTRGKIQLK